MVHAVSQKTSLLRVHVLRQVALLCPLLRYKMEPRLMAFYWCRGDYATYSSDYAVVIYDGGCVDDLTSCIWIVPETWMN